MRNREFSTRCGRLGSVPIRIAGLIPALILATCLAVPAVAADGNGAVSVRVAESSADRVVLEYVIGDYTVKPVMIDGGKYAHIKLGKESPLKSVGEPALPTINRSIIIPDDARMSVRVLSSKFQDVADVKVAPSKGFISRQIDPADVPYTFGKVYATDAFYPATVAVLQAPYILRDHRGLVVQLNPFLYNPVTQTLRVYTEVTLEVITVGPGEINVLDRSSHIGDLSLAFHNLYERHFINYEPNLRYTPLDETGDMLVICYDAWLPNVAPFVDHKNSRGITTTAVGVSTIGNNSSAITSYIQGIYDTSDLAFVLLVGDAAQVATPYASGGASDPSYALLAGSDNYPDIMVGRFSAETAAQVDTQVERTVEYEQMPATTQDWFWRGTGVASNQGPGDDGEYDNEHIDYIRDDLLAYGYTIVDQIYDPSGTAGQVSAALNAGRGIINYTGHGSITSWGSTGFSSGHVNALVNDNMLPFICSVACVNGKFDGYTCFGEAWLRATNSSEPTGAVGAYMSSIDQSWDPPMCAQDEFVDMYVSESYSALGTLLYAGSCQMMDEYGTGGNSMYNTWILFGDPSLRVVLTCTDAGTIELDKGAYACEDTANITVVDCGLNTDNDVVDTVMITVASDSEPAGEIVTLTEIDSASAQFTGSIALSTTDAAGVLLVAEGNTITATYIDADDGEGGTNVTVTDTATVDCCAPSISNVQTINIEARKVQVTFDADEPARGIVHYGLNCDTLPWTAQGSGYALSPIVGVSGLASNMTYSYTVEAEDEAGNSVSDDNGGECYSFTTPEVPDFFTELFNGDNDLDNLTLVFTPNGSNDYYLGCTDEISELPVDPAGGTSLSLSDDDYATVNLSAEATVSIYGNTYNQFFVGSNGYITFVHGETGWEESLETHFSGVPRVSALFDDLTPSSGMVSWKQLTDKAVVTYENVPEYGTSNSNTFQVELHFAGRIVISYLEVAATDGIAGLSSGEGVDPDYIESDLSAMAPCAPGDCDLDGDTDEDDYAVFVDCFSGDGGGVGPGCYCVDLDGDGDVDCDDWNLFEDLWSVGDPPTFAPCELPGAAAMGSRYLAITPPEGPELVALLIVGDPKDTVVSCVSLYVQEDGTLGPTPVYRAPSGPDGWNTINAHGPEIVPDAKYNVQGDYGLPGAPLLSPSQMVATRLWGDVEHNDVVNFSDINLIVFGFQEDYSMASLEEMETAPCDPDGVINFTDIQWAVQSFLGGSFFDGECSSPCS